MRAHDMIHELLRADMAVPSEDANARENGKRGGVIAARQSGVRIGTGGVFWEMEWSVPLQRNSSATPAQWQAGGGGSIPVWDVRLRWT